MRERRKWSWVVAVVAVVAVLLILVARPLAARFLPGTSSEEEAQTGEVVTAFIGDLASSATASGTLEAQRAANLALATSGRVEQVYVEVGDVVAVGDALVKLKDDALERAVTRAAQNLAIQEANLESLKKGPSAADLAAAEAAVTSAQRQLDNLLAGPREEEIAAAEANLRAAQANVARASSQLSETRAPSKEGALLEAQANVEDAQEAVQDAEDAYLRTVDCEQKEDGEWVCEPSFDEDLTRQMELRVLQARENLAAAQAELDNLVEGASQDAVGVSQANLANLAAQRDAAQANLDLLLAGPSEAQIASARATLADAQANLATLQAGPTEADIRSAEAQVEQARIALEQAQNDLSEATLRAPFPGVVRAVHVSEGEVAGGVAVELVDLDSLSVVLDVDEVDLGELSVGQPAQVTLEAWPDERLESEVVSIAPAANSLAVDNTIATFSVRLALPGTELPVRVGMTADARLQTAQREDVLLVPNRAIIADRQSGTYYVNLVEAGSNGETARRVEVTIGLRDAQYTEITAGLSEGDRVRIGDVSVPTFDPFEGGPGNNGGPSSGGPGGGGQG